MLKHPCVSQFMSFPESSWDPANQTCMWYLSNEGRTCKKNPSKKDKADARKLKNTILQNIDSEIPEQLLQDFAKLCCCAQFHREKLEDSGLLVPLIQRWQRELLNRGSCQYLSTTHTSLASTQASNIARDPAPSAAPAVRIIQTRLRSRQSSQIEAPPTPTESQDPSSSLFRPHKVSTTQTVATKLRAPLTTSLRPGTIYLFTRASSPGHVKIGYSRHGATYRLSKWAESCGYTPNLVGSIDDVPYARKVESLIHYQLASCWRVEKWCPQCARSHVEWFEISCAEAVRVAEQWCEWMKKANPYDAAGALNPIWVNEVQRLERYGTPVTAEVLLATYQRVITPEPTLSRLTPVSEQLPRNVTRDTVSRGTEHDITAEPEPVAVAQERDIRRVVQACLAEAGLLPRDQRTSRTLRSTFPERQSTVASAPGYLQRQDTNPMVLVGA